MSSLSFKTWSRKALLLGSLSLGLAQVGCAHPVMMEPSVVFSSPIGHGQVYGQMGLPGAVIYGQPQVIYTPPPPPRVIYAPPVYRQAPGWGYGQEYRHGWGHDRHEGGWGERHDGRRDDRRDGRRGHGDREDGRR